MAVHGGNNEPGAGKNAGWETGPVSSAFPGNDGSRGSGHKLEGKPCGGSGSWRERLCRKSPQNVSGQPQRTESAQGDGKATGRLGEDHLGDRETVEKTLERSQWTPRRPGTRVGDVDCPAVWRYESTRNW